MQDFFNKSHWLIQKNSFVNGTGQEWF